MLKSIFTVVDEIKSGNIQDLKSLRKQIGQITFLLIIGLCLVFLPDRILSGDYARLFVNLTAISLSIFGIFLIGKNRSDLAFCLIISFIYTVFPYLGYHYLYNMSHLSLIIALVSISSIFLFENKYFVYSIFVFAIIILIVLAKRHETSAREIIIVLSVNFVFFTYLRNLIINLQNRLIKENNNRQELIENLSDKNEEIKMYSNIMAHDIKAPLKNIKGFNQLIERELGQQGYEDRNIGEYVHFIHSSIISMESLINKLLLKSKLEHQELKKEAINFNAFIEEILKSFQFEIKEKDIKINRTDEGYVFGDKDSLNVLLSNLLSNSIKFQKTGKSHLPEVSIELRSNRNYDEIIINDNGIGMEEDQIQNIFKPFTRLKTKNNYSGSGVGLSFCKKIVDKHKGNIEVTSKPNIGTLIKIILPKTIS